LQRLDLNCEIPKSVKLPTDRPGGLSHKAAAKNTGDKIAGATQEKNVGLKADAAD
jgi:hypothetical protein